MFRQFHIRRIFGISHCKRMKKKSFKEFKLKLQLLPYVKLIFFSIQRVSSSVLKKSFKVNRFVIWGSWGKGDCLTKTHFPPIINYWDYLRLDIYNNVCSPEGFPVSNTPDLVFFSFYLSVLLTFTKCVPPSTCFS